MSSESLHVPRDRLTPEARLLHYAITSLKEELDAVDWYRQRAEDTEEEELKQILLHNMREEMEHASMLIEWIRRHDADFAGHLKTYLFAETGILKVERQAESSGPGSERAGSGRGEPGFTVGSLRGE